MQFMSHSTILFQFGDTNDRKICFATSASWKRVERAKRFSEEYRRVFLLKRSKELHSRLTARRVFSSTKIIIHLVREREIR